MAQIKGNFDIMKRLLDTFEEQDLSITERMLLIALVKYMDKHGTCYPSYKALQKTTGANASTVSRNIQSLARKGWITYTKGSNAKQEANRYQLNLSMLGLEDKPPALQVIDSRYLAQDGNYYDSKADYYALMQKAKIRI